MFFTSPEKHLPFFFYAWKTFSVCWAFCWTGSIQRVNTMKDMRVFWVFWGDGGLVPGYVILSNFNLMWGVITKRRHAKVPWLWDWLKSWQQSRSPRRGREVSFHTSRSQYVWWEVTGEPTVNGWDFFCLRGQGKSIQSSATSSATSPGQSQRWIWAQCALQQRDLGEGTIRKCSQVPLLSWRGPVTPLTSEEQRMIRVCCSPEGKTCLKPHSWTCHSFQRDRKWSSWGKEGGKD